MKKILWISLILLSLLAVLAACAQEGGGTLPNMEQKETGPATASNDSDPFREAEYRAYALGSALSVESFDGAAEAHEADGKVYHRVYSQTLGVTELVSKALYRYDSFYTYTNENISEKPVYFHGDTALYLYEDADTEMSLPDGDTLVNIQDPSVFGLLEDFIFSLSFEDGGEKPIWEHHEALFIVRGLDKTETAYTIYRDGTVFRNEDEQASQKLSEEVTAAIFAVKYAHARGANKRAIYADEEIYFNPDFADFGHVHIEVARNGQNQRLSMEESREFLRLVSDPAGEWEANFGYECFIRSNCGMGNRGEKLLDFTLFRVYEDGREDPMRTYSLYEDGKVVNEDNYYFEYRGSHIPTIDQLLIDRYIISRSNFDTQAILDFLNS